MKLEMSESQSTSRCAWKRALVSVSLVALSSNLLADILYRDRKPIAIGRGTVNKATITWQNCDSTTTKTFNKPPYWIDKADNCKVDASAFGLEERNGGYFVVNEHEAQK